MKVFLSNFFKDPILNYFSQLRYFYFKQLAIDPLYSTVNNQHKLSPH